MSTEFKPAFILHHRRYRNTSLLIDVFTPDEGRFSLVARGVSDSKRGLAGLLQPFNPLLISWTGRGEVKTLAKAEMAGKAISLTGTRLYCGFYINELLVKLTHQHDVLPALFAYYGHTLEQLALTESLDTVLRQFELNLLEQSGHAINLTTDMDTGADVLSEQWYLYDIEHGLRQTRSGSKQAIQGDTLIKMRNGDCLTGNARTESRYLMRRVIAFYLGNKTLKSREFFNLEHKYDGS